jgi:hypothetical protein
MSRIYSTVNELSTEDAIAIFKTLSSNHVLGVAEGNKMYQCKIRFIHTHIQLVHVSYYTMDVLRNVVIFLPNCDKYRRDGIQINEILDASDILDMLEQGGDCDMCGAQSKMAQCTFTWTGGFNIFDIVMCGTTVFRTHNMRCYMSMQDIPNDELSDVEEIPYDEDMVVSPHCIPSMKSANKQ